MKLRITGLLLVLGLAAGITALVWARAGGGSSSVDGFRGTVEPTGIAMPSFRLRDQNGKLVTASGLRGKVVVLTFLETQCREACPIIAGELGRTWLLLTPTERARATFVAISVDPRDDTRESRLKFLARHHAQRAIRYLAGPLPGMRALWRRFYVLSSVESGSADTHSSPVRIYDGDLMWLASQHVGVDLSPANLAHDIRVALARTG